jgi:hypothetical protein
MHVIFLDDLLIPIKERVNGISVVPDRPDDRSKIDYFHILLASQEVFLAQAAPAETFRPDAITPVSFSNFIEYERAYPGKPWSELAPFALVVGCSNGG